MFWGKFWRFLFLLFAVALLLITGLGAWLASDRMERLAQIYDEATIYETATGSQQAIVRGEGPSLLVLHGKGGGCDAGWMLARFVGVEDTMEVIAPSRPGYLGTPLEGRVAAEAQAESLATLLDTLERDKVAILAYGEATDVALTFAVKFPERVVRLVIVDGFFAPFDYRPALVPSDSMVKRMDALLQIRAKISPRKFAKIGGYEYLETDDADDFERALETAQSGFPITPRLEGIAADRKRLSMMGDLPKLDIPILVVQKTNVVLPQCAGDDFVAQCPDAKLYRVGDTRQFLWHSPDWDDTAKTIREFLIEPPTLADTPEQP